MNIADLVQAVERIAPPGYAEPWDNVGLLVGRRESKLRGPVLLTIDFTEPVLDEARRMGAGAVIAYHPTIFHPMRRIEAGDAKGRVVLGAIEAGIAVYSPHTALDAVPGGVADWLCDMLAPDDGATVGDAAVASARREGAPAAPGGSIGDRRALRAHTAHDPHQTHKVVTFAPESSAEAVRDALASVGAGRIGAYERCSFNIVGEGTFFGTEGTKPAVGSAGALETAREVRIEMVCPGDALGLVRDVLRQFHPYEEPAWDVYSLGEKPDRRIGAGRRLVLDRPATPMELARRFKSNLGVDAVKIAQASGEAIDHVGVCPGSGASLLEAAIADGCRAFVTGEMTHHEAAGAMARGCSVILAGHTNTERGYLPTFARRLNEIAPESRAVVSQADVTLFRTM